MNSNHQIVIISQHFWPSFEATAQLAFDLSVNLTAPKRVVSVITSTPGDTQINDIKIKRTFSIRLQTDSILTKTISGIAFVLQSAFKALQYASDNVIFIAYSNPPFICTALAIAKLFNRKVKYIFIYQDIFPESAVLSGILPASGPFTSLWRLIMRYGCYKASQIVVLNKDMGRMLCSKYGIKKNVHVIHNWALHEESTAHVQAVKTGPNKPVRRRTLSILYSGNLGRLHEFITILESVRILQEHDIEFVFVGAGPKRSQISSYKKHYDLKNLVIKNRVPRDQLHNLLSAADICLLTTLNQAESLVAPSKLYGILAAGKPLLHIGHDMSEISLMISQFKCGFSHQPGEITALCQTLKLLLSNPEIIELYGQNARHAYTTLYGKSKSIQTYIDIINKCL